MTTELLDFEDIQKQIEAAPMTWLPALLAICVEQSVRKGVFRDGGGLARYVEIAEKKAEALLPEGPPKEDKDD